MAQGGWPTVPAKAMRPGQRGQEMVILHRRLEISGDLVGQSIPDEYDAAVVVAVKKFQARHGSAGDRRHRQQGDDRGAERAGLDPARAAPGELEAAARPSAQHCRPLRRGQHSGRAGRGGRRRRGRSRGTPPSSASPSGRRQRFPARSRRSISILIGTCRAASSIKDLVPKGREFARRGQDMLAAYHMQAFDAAGNPLDPRADQLERPRSLQLQFPPASLGENSLGFVKINFPNKDAVYMHDTPLKSLFGKACVSRARAACACTMSSSWYGVDFARHARLELRSASPR